jgi:hypothetical protein
LISQTGRSGWSQLKQASGSPTLSSLEELIGQAGWLRQHKIDANFTAVIPQAKLRQFAAEAKGLDAARIAEVSIPKRYAIAAALLQKQQARSVDHHVLHNVLTLTKVLETMAAEGLTSTSKPFPK